MSIVTDKMLPFNDISYAQGEYNMDADSNSMVMIKASGGDGPLPGQTSPCYLDIQLDRNYGNAIRLGKIPFMYHFFGGVPSEADYFYAAVSPVTKGDGYCLDIERASNGWNPQTDPEVVSKVLQFVQRFIQHTGTAPWIYMNISTFNMYDWSPVTSICGLWIAAPSYSFTDDVPINHPYIAQQGPIVNGHDTDMTFLTLEQLRKYTYGNSSSTTPTTAPTTTMAPPTTTTTTTEAPAPPSPDPTTTTTTTTELQPDPSSTTTSTTEASPVTTTKPSQPSSSWLNIIWLFIVKIFKALQGGK